MNKPHRIAGPIHAPWREARHARYRSRFSIALAFSLAFHAFILALQLGEPGFGLPGLAVPQIERRVRPVDLDVRLVEAPPPVAVAPTRPPEPPIRPRTDKSFEVVAPRPAPATPPPPRPSRPKRAIPDPTPAIETRAREPEPQPKPQPRILTQDDPQQETFKVPPNETAEAEPVRAPEIVARKPAEDEEAKRKEEDGRRKAEVERRKEEEKQQEARRLEEARKTELVQQEEAKKTEEARRLVLEETRRQEETKKLEAARLEEAKRKAEEELRRKTEDGRRKEEEDKQQEARRLTLQKEQDAKRLEAEEAKRKEQEARRLEVAKKQEEEERRLRAEIEKRKQEEAHRLVLEAEALKRAEDAARQQAAARQKELEAQRLEEARRKEEDGRRKEEEARQKAETERRKEESARLAAKPVPPGAPAGGTADVAAPPGTPSGKELAAKILGQIRAPVATPAEALRVPPPPGAENLRRRLVFGAERDIMLRLYVESWRMKIERNGPLNYQPSAGLRASDYPVVTVAIRSDGSLEHVHISRSSGLRELDEAVRRISQLLAPYSVFPPELARQFDVIEIRRIWRFEETLRIIEEAR